MLVYKCSICGNVGGDEEKPFSTPICCGIEKGMAQVEGKCASVYVMQSYQSPVTGKWIDTPRQRREDLKNSGSRPWEGRDQETKVAQQREKDFDTMLDKTAEKAAIEAWHTIPAETKKILEKGE